MSTFYDPDRPPDRDEWTKLSAVDRTRVVQNYHDAARIKISKQHAYSHVFIEDQIAAGVRPIIRALERLQGQGLGRHDAIHAIIAVVNDYYRRLPITQTTREEQSASQLRFNEALDALSADGRATHFHVKCL